MHTEVRHSTPHGGLLTHRGAEGATSTSHLEGTLEIVRKDGEGTRCFLYNSPLPRHERSLTLKRELWLLSYHLSFPRAQFSSPLAWGGGGVGWGRGWSVAREREKGRRRGRQEPVQGFRAECNQGGLGNLSLPSQWQPRWWEQGADSSAARIPWSWRCWEQWWESEEGTRLGGQPPEWWDLGDSDWATVRGG